MEKYEGLKLVNENGETTLMTKSEYLELAKQKGWDTTIPQLEDGTYDCDVFGGDNVRLDFRFAISGTLFLKDSASLFGDVSACDGIILGDDADIYGLSSANGDITLGNKASTCGDLIGKNFICGDDLDTNFWSISATDGFVILGKNVSAVVNDDDDDDDDYGISATEDIICDDEPSA